ncbi:hypothetical protein [Pseudomonas sp. NA-150]|uniref:hypothetical protein n=1 Tax=Pseudomonas sp. NA-150 TaxID=3367525 RepID=UPI0037C99B45
MSTLHEIAANHARMAQARAEASTGLNELQPHIVGGFEVTTMQEQEMPLHIIVGVQDGHLGQVGSYSA